MKDSGEHLWTWRFQSVTGTDMGIHLHTNVTKTTSFHVLANELPPGCSHTHQWSNHVQANPRPEPLDCCVENNIVILLQIHHREADDFIRIECVSQSHYLETTEYFQQLFHYSSWSFFFFFWNQKFFLKLFFSFLKTKLLFTMLHP